jgi:hypothetical protein
MIGPLIATRRGSVFRLSLVKSTVAGGGYFKIVNQSAARGLARRLGYAEAGHAGDRRVRAVN